MNTEIDFNENVDLFSKSNPQAAILLSFVDGSGFEFCKAASGDLNLKISEDGKKTRFLHSQKNPLEEAETWFSKLILKDVQVLYVFGSGLGYYYEAARTWLKKNKEHQLVFLEDNPVIIHRLLETKLGSRILQDPQVHLHYFPHLNHNETHFEWLYWAFIQKQIKVSALNFYVRERKEFFAQLSQKILYEASNKNDMVDEYLKHGVAFFRNFYPNILALHRSYLGSSLFGKFPQVPAIICGAGPSLKKNAAVLKKLQDNALIFAGGSAINALNAHSIFPHFGAGIDPNPAQYQRYATNSAFETPFFYRNRLHHQAFQTIHGPRLYIPGAGGYDIADWFEKELRIEKSTMDEGHNVVNFCAEIARELGCNPIIFVGMDLAYTNMQAYAAGVVSEAKVRKKEFAEQTQFESAAIRWKSIQGKPIYTLWKWIAEAEWISEFAKKNPDLSVINATEGGIGFEGIPNVPLKTVAEEHLKHPFDLKARVHGEIQNAMIPSLTETKIRELLEILKNSLHASIQFLDILKQETDVVKKIIEEGKEPPTGLHTGKSALAETDLIEEPAFHAVLDIFNTVYLHVFNREVQHLSSSNVKTTSSERNVKLLEINAKRYTFLKQTAQLNVFLIEDTLKSGEKE